ncbi:glycosyltransferase family 32 protein [Agrobacterium larrymoorei]|uniref:Mannosyltransferase n=1 Tax=Agrobacterium larrymoorei TaxID=160699 RepID=A0A4D7DMK3_9HYPH|nr:glycosyltransferase [Agrobacterium larrymoorei]QCI96874.1 mannosyltransferase [Agrobacterium larrymoorei]QYA07700.1 mannosyltransferase [Agrobacterium larrymoorei]
MPDKAYFDAKLAEIRHLVAERNFDEAESRLQLLSEESDQHFMGEQTALGLPRKLHSAHLRLEKARGDVLRRAGYQYLLVPPVETFEPYGRFSSEERKLIAAKNREAVPRVIHQIWIGDRDVPPATEAWAAHAKANGLTYRLWREEDLAREGISTDPVFQRMLSEKDFPGAVDVARYVILSRFGGIYLDCDFYPARDDASFFDVLPMIGLTAFAEDTPRQTGRGSVLFANSFIAAPAGHPVFERILQALPDILQHLPRAPAWWATGPLIFTVVARAGSVSLANADFVAAALPDRAPFSAVEDARAKAGAENDGLLIAWKSW